MKKDSFAVVIPTYNRVTSTVQAVLSAVNQTIEVNEIIIIDDGSEAMVLKELETELQKLNDSRIKLIKSTAQRHPGKIRNLGIIHSTSNWICFLDSDDEWINTKIEIQFYKMIAVGALASCTNIVLEQSDVSSNKKKDRIISFAELVKSNHIVNSSVIIERELLASVGNVVESYSVRGVEDYATWLRVATKTQWLLIEEQLLIYNNDTEDSIRKDTQHENYFDTTYALLNWLMWRTESFSTQTKKFVIKNAIKMLVRIAK
jgi:teichuronic acid biosynthesis glycosyltransferase TuaG